MSSQERSRHKGKRKSVEASASTPSLSQLKVVVSEPSSSLGPVFVNFPSVKPSRKTAFSVYSTDPSSSTDITKQKTLLAGETEDVEFFSHNRNRDGPSEGSDVQYLPAIYDPDAGTLHIHASTPLYLLSHRAKRMRQLEATASAEQDYRARRNDLGEAFGTKKAKSQIRANERNKLNAGSMENVRGHLMETIGQKDEEAEALPSNLIPTPDMETKEPSQVYPRGSLLSDTEWSAIDVVSLLKARDDRTRAGLLPYRRSRIVEARMRDTAGSSQSSSIKKTAIRLAYFLTCLLAFKDISNRLSNTPSAELPSKLPGIPPPLISGLLDRFSERIGKKHQVTEKMQTKLLAYICVLYLHIEDFNVNIGKVAKELNLPPQKVGNILRSLGCKVDLPSTEEREQMGITLEEARTNRRAVLKTPVKFPKARTRAPARR